MKIKLSHVALAARFILAAIFIGASFYKIQAPGAFAEQIFNYKLLPPWAVNPAAIILPWVQLVSGIFLFLGRFKLGSAFWILVMLATFQFALAAALVRGLNISCGCFKSGGSPASWLTFGRDSLMFLTAIFYFFWEWKERARAAE